MELTRKQAIEYLNVDGNAFDNYRKKSGEIKGFQKNPGGWWYFKKTEIDIWKKNRDKNTVNLSIEEYKKCFEFALKVVYGGAALGSRRRMRTEMEASDNWITGILAEHGFKKFMKDKFDLELYLDEEVHPGVITPRDITHVKKEGIKRKSSIFIGIKSSKMKNVYLIADEHGKEGRSAEIYIFIRVGLPRDHLFRYLRRHSFIQTANEFLKTHEGFRTIEKLEYIPIWICGFAYAEELDCVNDIDGQEFEEEKYVKCVTELHNSDKDWKKLIESI